MQQRARHRFVLFTAVLLAAAAGTTRADEPASWTLASCPQDSLVQAWKDTVEKGCKVKPVEGLLPLVPRLLRNVPFAVRGHPFKSPELRAFFEGRKGSCDAAWYAPKAKKVKLPKGPEQACARRLKRLEKKLREAMPVPAALETFVLENAASELPSEMSRMRGEADPGNSASLERTDSGWGVTFYSQGPVEDGEPPYESSLTVRCDSKGKNCEVLFAG